MIILPQNINLINGDGDEMGRKGREGKERKEKRQWKKGKGKRKKVNEIERCTWHIPSASRVPAAHSTQQDLSTALWRPSCTRCSADVITLMQFWVKYISCSSQNCIDKVIYLYNWNLRMFLWCEALIFYTWSLIYFLYIIGLFSFSLI